MKLAHLPILVLLLLATSCTKYRNIVYLQDTTSSDTVSGFYPQQIPSYKIQTRDVLYIQILSMNKEVTEVINATPSYLGNIYTNDAGVYIYGYNVNDSGYVEVPIVGKVRVADKTLDEAKEAITRQTLKILKDPTVIVKLISFRVSVFGEVNTPGSFVNYNNQITILEAISKSGDVTPYGNRRKILVVRSTPQGTKTISLDLTDRKILQSEGFYLAPNDMVYVEPVKSRNFKNNIPTYSLMLGAITTLILVLNYMDN